MDVKFFQFKKHSFTEKQIVFVTITIVRYQFSFFKNL
jgi:hypothetical protein